MPLEHLADPNAAPTRAHETSLLTEDRNAGASDQSDWRPMKPLTHANGFIYGARLQADESSWAYVDLDGLHLSRISGNDPRLVLHVLTVANGDTNAQQQDDWKRQAAIWLNSSDEAGRVAHTAFACDTDEDERAWELVDSVLHDLAVALDPQCAGRGDAPVPDGDPG